jgi:hypothetical protein
MFASTGIDSDWGFRAEVSERTADATNGISFNLEVFREENYGDVDSQF